MTKSTHHDRPIPGSSHGSAFLLFTLLLLVSTADAQPGNMSPGQYNSPNFNPSMAIIIVILVSAFFFMGFFSVYLRRCGQQGEDAVGVRSNRGAGWGRSRRSKGLDQEVIETFPTLVYSDVKELKIGKSALECAVCLSEFQDDETLRLLPKCSHVFHVDCIDAWLATKTTCPVCRCNLVSDPNAPPTGADAAGADALPGAGTEEQVASAPPPDHVAIDVDERVKSDEWRTVEPVDQSGTGSKRRVLWRSWSLVLPAKSPISPSTRHFVVQPGENVERFTLRLPEHVRKEILARRLQRSTSCLAYPVARGEGSFTKGYRGGWAGGDGSHRSGGSVGGRSFKLGKWEWSAKSDRWSILTRTFSFSISKAEGEESMRRGEGSTNTTLTAKRAAGVGGEGSTRIKGFPSVRDQFDCINGGTKGDGAVDDDEKSTAALVPRV